MRTLILGAGGIGGFFGGHLARTGADVTFLVREKRAAQLRQAGLVIESPLGALRTAVNVVTRVEAARQPDLILVACKAYDLQSAMDSIAPVVRPGTVVLPLLNGLAHIDTLERRFPGAATWGGLAHLGVTITDHGVIRHLNDLSIIQFGPRPGPTDSRASQFAAHFASTPVNATARRHIMQDMWEKFVFIATLAGMTCLMRASIGTIVSSPAGEGLITRLLDECTAVAAASGHRPADTQLATYRHHLTQRGSSSKASMLRDIERGGHTEAEHIIGDMLARARRLSVQTPVLEIAYTHLQAYEADRTARWMAPL